MSDLEIGDGAWPILLTAFDEHDNLDRAAIGALLDFYCELGIPGVLALGQASEMLLLKNDERFRVAEYVAQHPRGDLAAATVGNFGDSLRRSGAQPPADLRHGHGRCCGRAFAAAIGGQSQRATSPVDAAGRR